MGALRPPSADVDGARYAHPHLSLNLAEIDHHVAEGDLVMTRETFHGRNGGEFMGVALSD